MSEQTHGPLRGLKVLELGSFIAGPFCGQILGDLGADVVKVELPGGGDAMRQWGLKTGEGDSVWWKVIARNKRCISIDLRRPEGRTLALSLAEQSDVVIENFRPGTLEKWGLGPAELQARNPKLVLARISGYGQDGPYAERAGFAAVAEALAGLRNLTGYPDRPPTRVGISIGDSLAGLFATIGVLGAILAQRDGAPGQVVDVSITESVLAVLESVVADYSAAGAIRARTGTLLPGLAPSNLYPTLDGAVVIAANADNLFRRLAAAMGQPELATDPRFATHTARGANQAELDGIVAAWTAGRSTAELVEIVNAAGVPAGPVNDAAAVHDDPHLLAREALVTVETDGKPLRMQGVAPKFSATPAAVRWPGAAPGAHTDEVLGTLLGLDGEAVAALRASGVVE